MDKTTVKISLIVFTIAILFSACSKTSECRQNTFGDNTWQCYSPGFNRTNIIFKSDGKMSYTPGTTGSTTEVSYEFDENCSGLTIESLHHTIMQNTGDSISIRRDGNTYDYILWK